MPVPEKPCPPERPFAYSGPILKIKEAVDGTTWTSIVSGTSKDAFLAYSTTNMPAEAFSSRKGYLSSTGDNSGTDTSNVGHVFGRLGEGNANMPGVSAPFYWGAVKTTDKPGIMVALFPQGDSDPGLDSAAKKIVIEGKGQDFAALTLFAVPTQPAAAVAPDSLSASMLGGSLGAISLLVASSLY